jgi:hypothetical protein
MLFVSLLRPIDGSSKEHAALRAKWQPPEGVKQVAEYWLHSGEVSVIYVFETDSPAALLAMRTYWSDSYEIDTVPAITGEDGMRLVQKMLSRPD